MFHSKQRDEYKYKKIRLEENFTLNSDADREFSSFFHLKELIITKSKRKKRTWIIGCVAFVVVAVLIVAAVFLLKDTNRNRPFIGNQREAIALEDLLQGRLNSRGFNATWISGNELMHKDINENIVIFNVKENKSTVLLNSTNPIVTAAFQYTLSADQKYLLIGHDYQKLYRHSFTAKYTVIDLKTHGSNLLTVGGNPLQQLSKWGPVGNSIVFVHQNNIFYKSDVAAEPIRITSDGLFGFVYNGIPDWVYEEEVFSSNDAIWISPDGKKLTYAKFDDRNVPIMTVPFYGEAGSLSSQYPKASQIRYPKPGVPNPTVSLHVVSLLNNSHVHNLDPPKHLIQKQPILSTVVWANADAVTAIWMNRVQNEASIVSYEINESITSTQVKNLKESNGWLELFVPPKFSKDGSKLIIILSQEQANNTGGFRHIVQLERREDTQILSLTSGNYVVTEILDWNEDSSLIYFTATTEEDPAVQHVYSVSTTTKEKRCLSCGIKSSNFNAECLYNTATFSKDFSYYVLSCEGPSVPEIALYTIENKRLMLWENNDELVELVNEKAIPTTQRLTFDIDNGFKAQVRLKLPPNIDTSGNVKYPMLVNVYGGPDSYQVTEKFGLDWGSYLASNKSIIYALIDGRGSGLKGDKILFSGYRKLGTVEIVDQINVTKQIQDTLKYVDAKRTAIWGWSYGGYASAMALANDTNGIFKCGISVAPVTDWSLYDSIYTERFMGLPTIEDNYKGYHNAQLVTKYDGLRGKLYYLIHGTLDDNVHYQQSMLWSKTLEQHDILFRQQTYPDEDHSLLSVRPHLYHSLENFLDECFVRESDN